jgi:integrase
MGMPHDVFVKRLTVASELLRTIVPARPPVDLRNAERNDDAQLEKHHEGQEFLSLPELAARYHVDPERLRGRLRRWMPTHQADWKEVVDRASVKTDRRLRRRMLLPAEWSYLRAAALTSGPREGMNPLERVVLYAVAIQTGLRSAELRSLTKADLFLAGEKPYVRCRAENTKNKQEARQYIQADVAEDLRRMVATKTPTARVFAMPDEWHVADMLRGDLTEARKAWLDELKHDFEAVAKRKESDFLAVANHEGETLDFHSLRHTCGSWLALQGVHPNIVKTVMRHSTITLTMDTYGHLLPDQHSEAIGGMAKMLADSLPLAATGTAGNAPAVQSAVGVRKQPPSGANKCARVRDGGNDEQPGNERKPLRIANVCETMPDDASGRGGNRTHTGVAPQGILSPLCLPFHHAAGLVRSFYPGGTEARNCLRS